MTPEQWTTIRRLVAWLDTTNGTGEHETAIALMKLTEEAGEIAQAYIGTTGQNARKGYTHEPADVAGELCDVILTAAVALHRFTDDPATALEEKIQHVASRSLPFHTVEPTRLQEVEAEREAVYRERAHLLAWLTTQHPAVIAPDHETDEPGTQILYLYAGGNQMSWHIAPRDTDLFQHVEHVPSEDLRALWDGHTTPAKYARIRNLLPDPTGPQEPARTPKTPTR